MKKILLIDDSALMRRVLCDIINGDKRFRVVDRATNGLEAFDLLSRNTYDAVVLDINMPNMNELQLLQKLRKYKISAKVMVIGTDTGKGTKTTLDALDLGALDFVHKPETTFDCLSNSFKQGFLQTLAVVADSEPPVYKEREKSVMPPKRVVKHIKKSQAAATHKLVAIASSTGGPKALQAVISKLPKELNAPVLVVQHMPVGFTASLSERLNSISKVEVKEAAEGDVLENGHVYIARSGKHMKVRTETGRSVIYYSDEPAREGVKPCANYMYESLADSRFEEIICVVMTGMGTDGTKGIQYLEEKKAVWVIAQEQSTCAVYGMPRSVVELGMADKVVELEQIAQEIIVNVGGKT